MCCPQIPREQLEFGTILGKGNFGMVARGRLLEGPGAPTTVAVKQLLEGASADMQVVLSWERR